VSVKTHPFSFFAKHLKTFRSKWVDSQTLKKPLPRHASQSKTLTAHIHLTVQASTEIPSNPSHSRDSKLRTLLRRFHRRFLNCHGRDITSPASYIFSHQSRVGDLSLLDTSVSPIHQVYYCNNGKQQLLAQSCPCPLQQ